MKAAITTIAALVILWCMVPLLPFILAGVLILIWILFYVDLMKR